jgi:large subunit ribosomal protein L5
VLVSSCWLTARKFASSSPAAKKWQGGINISTLVSQFREKINQPLIEKFGYKSPMQVPRINKITLTGVSEAVADKKVMDNAVADIWVPRPKACGHQGKKAIAGFKIREDLPIAWSRCGVACRCMSSRPFQTVACRVYVTSVVFVALMAAATTTSASKSKLFSLKSSTTRLMPRGLNISITTTAKTDEE